MDRRTLIKGLGSAVALAPGIALSTRAAKTNLHLAKTALQTGT